MNLREKFKHLTAYKDIEALSEGTIMYNKSVHEMVNWYPEIDPNEVPRGQGVNNFFPLSFVLPFFGAYLSHERQISLFWSSRSCVCVFITPYLPLFCRALLFSRSHATCFSPRWEHFPPFRACPFFRCLIFCTVIVGGTPGGD